MGIVDMQSIGFSIDKLQKSHTRMEEEFQTMLDLLEKNRKDDLRRLVTPEFLQDRINILEQDFKFRFEERFNALN